ncbi:hypothetical protein GQ53DRAFT_745319 [Thozetella sp. PMI_491]|nr:hypothetical protein GQ53DRAFT_745319 [Thozetella sp. PMI_491]
MAFASADWRRPKKLEDYLDIRLPLIMIAKLAAPLSSPTLAAAQLRNRLPTQLRRLLPLYIACVIFVLIVLNLNIFHTGKQQIVFVRPGFSSGSDAAGGSVAPPPRRKDFPHKIWQTWKVGPLVFEERDLNNARSWTEQNPEWRYEVITDGSEMQYVEFHYGEEGFNRPDIVEFYRGVEAKIIKADLLRYLIMYAEGGIYADIDVEALKPMSKFIPDRYDTKDIDMIVGVEIDEPDWKDHPILGPKSMSFCQWTFMCKPQLPVMMHLIEHIMTWLNDVASNQNKTISDVELDFDEVISGTGPSAFTNAIMADMNKNKKDSTPTIDWDMFHDIQESKLVANVLVLTVEAFAAGQGHSNSGNHEARAALVRHHYHASNWPSRHPRYKHPAYGEVEQCNWNDECVHRWDDDVAAFEKMNEEDQKRIIGEKEREREEEERKRKEEEEEQRRKEDEDRQREEDKKRKEEEAQRQREEEEKRAKSKGEQKPVENKDGKQESPDKSPPGPDNKDKPAEKGAEKPPADKVEEEKAKPSA